MSFGRRPQKSRVLLDSAGKLKTVFVKPGTGQYITAECHIGSTAGHKKINYLSAATIAYMDTIVNTKKNELYSYHATSFLIAAGTSAAWPLAFAFGHA
jgi:hypothetical protein